MTKATNHPRKTHLKKRSSRLASAAAIAGLTLTLGACGSFDPGGLFGTDVVPPLPGERISVLSHTTSLTSDVESGTAKILLPRPVVNADWPQAGGFANHAMHHVAAADSLGEVWSADIGEEADDELRLNAPPIVANGVVYTIDAETEVRAFRADNGRKIWEIDLKPEDEEDDGHIPGGIAYEDGRLAVTAGFNKIFVLDAKSGKVLWDYKVDSPFRAAPTMRGGRVFAISLNNTLYALSAYSGKVLWTYQALNEPASILGGASPAVDQGVVIAPFSSGEIVALKVGNGRELWADSLVSTRRTDVVSSLSHVRGRPVIDRGMVFANSHGGVMVAIDLRSGRRVWSRDIGGIESIWVAGDYLFTLTLEGEIISLNRRDGKVLWVTPLPRWEDEEDKEDMIIWSGPLLVSDRLLVTGSHGLAMAVSPYSGKVLGTVEMPDSVHLAPIVANGTVFFLSDNAELIAYR